MIGQCYAACHLRANPHAREHAGTYPQRREAVVGRGASDLGALPQPKLAVTTDGAPAVTVKAFGNLHLPQLIAQSLQYRKKLDQLCAGIAAYPADGVGTVLAFDPRQKTMAQPFAWSVAKPEEEDAATLGSHISSARESSSTSKKMLPYPRSWRSWFA